MIQFTNIQQHLNVPFHEYLKMPGLSTSFLKNQVNGVSPDFKMTDKVRLGSLVDDLLTSPANADMRSPLYPTAKKIAFKFKERYGDMMLAMVPQVSYTGVATYNGFSMPVKGRLDFLLQELAVIDIKVTFAKDIAAVIEFMGYLNQMFLYANLSRCKVAYLLVYSVPLDKFECHTIDCSGDSIWWETQLVNFGKVA